MLKSVVQLSVTFSSSVCIRDYCKGPKDSTILSENIQHRLRERRVLRVYVLCSEFHRWNSCWPHRWFCLPKTAHINWVLRPSYSVSSHHSCCDVLPFCNSFLKIMRGMILGGFGTASSPSSLECERVWVCVCTHAHVRVWACPTSKNYQHYVNTSQWCKRLNTFSTDWWLGSAGKGFCCPAWQHEFDPWDPQEGIGSGVRLSSSLIWHLRMASTPRPHK